MTIFEVKRNRAGKWYYHDLESGRILARSAAYYSKGNAVRAAKARVKKTPNSKWRYYQAPSVIHQDADFR